MIGLFISCELAELRQRNLKPAGSDLVMATSSLRYDGKVVIVTGGSKGIGLGCVRVFVRHGAKVVFCARGEKEGVLVQEEVNRDGPGEAFFVKCDMASEEDIKNLIDTTVDRYGGIDCLINNAGIHPPFAMIDDFSGEDFKNLLNINLVSYFLTSKYALPHLRKRKGNIINDSSLVGTMGQCGAVTYVTTKGGILAMTKALAIDEAAHGVRVNSISPGNIMTNMWQTQLDQAEDPEKMKQAGFDAQLLGRFGTIEECGMTCLFLAADATFCTGSDIPLTGGAELDYGRKTRQGDRDLYS